LHGAQRQADLCRVWRGGIVQSFAASRQGGTTALAGRRSTCRFGPGSGVLGLDPALPDTLAKRSPLAIAWRNLDHELDKFITDVLAAA